MSTQIEFCAGKVHSFPKSGNKKDGTGGVGSYALIPPIEVGEGSNLLIMGVPIELREIAQPVVTLDDTRILYTFGAAWTTATVMLKLLIGDGDDSSLNEVQAWYEANRLSKLTETPIQLSIAKKAYPVFLVGMSLGSADADFNTQDIVLTFMLSDE